MGAVTLIKTGQHTARKGRGQATKAAKVWLAVSQVTGTEHSRPQGQANSLLAWSETAIKPNSCACPDSGAELAPGGQGVDQASSAPDLQEQLGDFSQQ